MNWKNKLINSIISKNLDQLQNFEEIINNKDSQKIYKRINYLKKKISILFNSKINLPNHFDFEMIPFKKNVLYKNYIN